MAQLLEDGREFQTDTGLSGKIVRYLGGGTQGEVYEVSVSGKQMAIKWYLPGNDTEEQRDQLEELINKGRPNEAFLWPEDIVTVPGMSGYGYLMPLRYPRFRGMADLMTRKIRPGFAILATAGLNISESFLRLHSKGLCYRDVNFNNIFLDPQTGDIQICDNDNVSVDGRPSNVMGTMRFMAPEIVRREAFPSTNTDLYSLSVLLFYIFFVHHPLEGRKEFKIRCLGPTSEMRLFGDEPLFIFDPNDRSNEPVPADHTGENQQNAITFWQIYPQFLKDLFMKAFTDGIRDPVNGRVIENQWRYAMVTLRDSIVYCPECGHENFHDPDAIKASGGSPGRCCCCSKTMVYPYRMRVGNKTVMLNHDTRLYPHHVDADRQYDFSVPVAEVIQHPADPSKWGLKNLSGQRWTLTSTSGATKEIEPGKPAVLGVGHKINFGKATGEIR